MRKKNTPVLGFTLVELMITLGIAGLLLALAIPSFTTLIGDNRLTTYTNEFIGSLMLAKSEAIKRGASVTILRRDPTPGVWESGWDVFVDPEDDKAFDLDVAKLCLPNQDCLLRSHGPLSTGYTLRTTGGNWATYTSDGLGNPAATFNFCDDTQDPARSHQIVINIIGRARVTIGVPPNNLCP